MSNILQQIGLAVKGKVDGVQANVTAEETARIAAVSAEATARAAADSTNATAIADEATTARAAEQANAAAITAEATTARAAESANATAISDEETRATAAEQANATAISDEATARAAADTSEASTRAAADTANATAISDEETRATAAESTLTTNLATEVTDRQTAVSAEASTRAAAITALDTAKADLAGAAFTGAVSGTDLTLTGNLTVSGTTTSLETVNSQVKDSLMLLNDGAASSATNANDVGLIMERGSSDDGNVAMVYDEGEDKFCMYKTSAAATDTDITDSDASASLVPLKVSDVFLGSDNIGSYSDFSTALG